MARGRMICMDPVEVAPDYGQAGLTALMEAQLLMSFLGYIIHAEDKGA